MTLQTQKIIPTHYYDVHLMEVPAAPKLWFWYAGENHPLYLQVAGKLSDEDLRDKRNSMINRFPAVELQHVISGTMNEYVAKAMLHSHPPTNLRLMERWMNNISDGDLRKFIGIWYKYMNCQILATPFNADYEVLYETLKVKYPKS